VIVAGLTGGIATGKSTVAAIFEEAGAFLIDADRIAREVVRPGTPAYSDIVAHFGRGILLADGEIDRKLLAALIFSNPVQRRSLEAIVHPHVKKETARRLALIRQDAPDAVVVVDVPLLFETGMNRDYHPVIVVYIPEPLQLARLVARDGITETEALARIRSQMPIETKKSLATHVIDNSGSIEATRTQVLEIYHQLARKGAKGREHRA
jgi:dephospho-CoA kinase